VNTSAPDPLTPTQRADLTHEATWDDRIRGLPIMAIGLGVLTLFAFGSQYLMWSVPR